MGAGSNRAVMLDADRVSMAVSRMIVARFGGNRALAVASAKKTYLVSWERNYRKTDGWTRIKFGRTGLC